MPANELKPCPFCPDVKPEIEGDFYGFYSIQCTCGAGGPKSNDLDEAEELWNRRTGYGAMEVERE